MQNTAEIHKLLLKENKSGLHYILKMLDHKRWFWTYEESYTKKQLQEAALSYTDYSCLHNAHLYKQHITK